jgi:ElaB/YqjD/DUF883 family membrane-anchored ribosome-binding protein
MTTPDPDQLRRQIEHTQRHLSSDVDLLAEKVTPSRVVHRRVNRARNAVSSMRSRVMGSTSEGSSSTSHTGEQLRHKASSAADSVSSAVDDATRAVQDTAKEAPRAVRHGTEGNPIAAGLIAFGAGWLLSTLAPPTKPEQQLAEQATEWAGEHSGPVKEELSQVADEMKEKLRGPAEDAVESVRSTTADAASTVKGDARSAAEDVGDRAQQAREAVRHNQT